MDPHREGPWPSRCLRIGSLALTPAVLGPYTIETPNFSIIQPG